MASLPYITQTCYHFGDFGWNAVDLLSVNRPSIGSSSSSWPHRYCFVYADVNVIDIRLAIRIIDFHHHLDQFPWHVSILLKMNISTWNTLAQTTTTCYLSAWCFVLTTHHSCLPQNDLFWKLYFLVFVHPFDCHCHVINDHTFFSRCDVAERGWPSFKSFETDWETVLTWRKTITLVN